MIAIEAGLQLSIIMIAIGANIDDSGIINGSSTYACVKA